MISIVPFSEARLTLRCEDVRVREVLLRDVAARSLVLNHKLVVVCFVLRVRVVVVSLLRVHLNEELLELLLLGQVAGGRKSDYKKMTGQNLNKELTVNAKYA